MCVVQSAGDGGSDVPGCVDAASWQDEDAACVSFCCHGDHLIC